jgi:hypothetical protein
MGTDILIMINEFRKHPNGKIAIVGTNPSLKPYSIAQVTSMCIGDKFIKNADGYCKKVTINDVSVIECMWADDVYMLVPSSLSLDDLPTGELFVVNS